MVKQEGIVILFTDELIELLAKSTVRLTLEQGKICTGFFVAPKLVLTCAHCIFYNKKLMKTIKVYWSGKEIIGKPEYTNIENDLGLISVDIDNHPCVLLGSNYFLGDLLLTLGYSDEYPNGDSVTLEFEGKSYFKKEKFPLLNCKKGLIRPGMSGSPILNIKNGQVCGMVKTTKDRKRPQGGRAISVDTIFKIFPQIKKKNFDYHLDNNLWSRFNIKLKNGFGQYDKSRDKTHFFLFPHEKIDINDIFVQPNYKIINYYNFNESFPDTKDFINDSLEILNRQKILFLFGSYGSGKTFLSKVIQKKLNENGKDTIFLKFSEISDITNYQDFFNLANSRKINESLYIIFDGYDEINFLDRNRISIKDRILKNIISLSNEDGIYIIFNSRFIPTFEQEIYLNICDEIYSKKGTELVSFIHLDYFQKEQINNWLDAFSNYMASKGHEERLYFFDLKRLHKNLIEACSNPLFLYQIVSTFYAKGISSINDIYTVYECFVDNTVRGKFFYENPKGSTAIREILKYYRLFLKNIAKKICTLENLKIDQKQLYNWYLDSNTEQYGIDENELESEIKNIANNLLGFHWENNIDGDRLISNILNCYFLEKYGNKWKFRDNNIIFFLLAEIYFDSLNNILNNFDNGKSLIQLYKEIRVNENLPLHPLSLELLFNRLDKLTNDQKSNLQYIIKNYILKGLMLQVNKNSLIELNINKINIDLLLSLTFLHLNRDGYNNLQYFFKRFNWILNAAKIIDRKYLHLAQRFFKSIKISSAEIRRQNFSGYNFDGSKLLNVRFIQTKLFKTRKNKVTFNNVLYYLSDFYEVEMNESSGNIEFFYCIISNLRINNPGKLSLTFRRCYIKNIEIHSQNKFNSSLISIEMYFCDIDSFIFRRSKSKNFKINYCSYNSFKFEGSEVHFFEKDSRKKASKKFEKDAQSKIFTYKM